MTWFFAEIIAQILTLSIFLVETARANIEGKTAEGRYASILNYPHAAHLGLFCNHLTDKGEDGEKLQNWSCGSSILNQHIILTAAHCVYNCRPYTGFISITIGSENRWIATHIAEDYIVHRNYTEWSMENDMALVKIRRKMKLGIKVKRAIVMRHPPHIQLAFISGWGRVNEENETASDWLRKALQRILHPEDCLDTFPRMPECSFCTNTMEIYGQSDYLDLYDSGSGLIADNILIGVVSYKQNHSNSTVYTNTSHFYKWILAASRKLHCRRPLTRLFYYLNYLKD